MSWIQENKFVAGLIGVTVVVGGGILYFGSSQGGAFDQKKAEYEELKGKYVKLEKAGPYPNKENQRAREVVVSNYSKQIMGVRSALFEFQPDAMSKNSPKEFSDARVKMASELNAAFAGIGVTMPETTEFGFERYSEKLPKPEATPKLMYQLGATEWLLTKLVESKPSALVNISRPSLLIEDGKPAAPAETGKKKKKKKKSKAKSKAPAEKPYELMPMEMTFTADEAAVRYFLKEMVNSKEYFYAIRALRVRNERQTEPTEKDASFPEPELEGGGGGIDVPFGGFPGLDGVDAGDADGVADAAAAPEAATKPSEIILKRVLGSEKLQLHIAFDIVLFKPKTPAANNKLNAAVKAK